MIKVYVRENILTGLEIAIVLEVRDEPRRILRLAADDVRTWEEIPAAANVDPTLRLDDDMGRALLDALTRHYAGAEDTRALRRDYDAERARVDKLIGALIEGT